MKPIIKWAGGKTQLADEILRDIGDIGGKYYEPFIGGGALLMQLHPDKAVINDVNSKLIWTYRTVRDNPAELIKLIEELDRVPCTDCFYKEKRDTYNRKVEAKELDTELAALFIWLNKHGFNGLYRENNKGQFNVSWNKKAHVDSVETDNLIELSEYLRHCEIRNLDFEEAVKDAKAGDFVFFDPPYIPVKQTDFVKYTGKGFGSEEQERLARLFDSLTERGVWCILTNSNAELTQQLYEKYDRLIVDVRRSINSDATNRTGTEVIIRNFRQVGKNIAT